MTQDEIIEMAEQSGAVHYWHLSKLEAFAKLVAAKEREEIVQFIERTNLGALPEKTALHYAQLLRSYSAAIRARGEA
jgi:predicted house-cleaning noncanonical NTP pyrophosphatase (MazG superfamily)